MILQRCEYLDIILKIVLIQLKYFGLKVDEEIAPFNPPIGNIRRNNPSDIVVKLYDGNIYYGFSLKKDKLVKMQTPTLNNKPIFGSKSY